MLEQIKKEINLIYAAIANKLSNSLNRMQESQMRDIEKLEKLIEQRQRAGHNVEKLTKHLEKLKHAVAEKQSEREKREDKLEYINDFVSIVIRKKGDKQNTGIKTSIPELNGFDESAFYKTYIKFVERGDEIHSSDFFFVGVQDPDCKRKVSLAELFDTNRGGRNELQIFRERQLVKQLLKSRTIINEHGTNEVLSEDMMNNVIQPLAFAIYGTSNPDLRHHILRTFQCSLWDFMVNDFYKSLADEEARFLAIRYHKANDGLSADVIADMKKVVLNASVANLYDFYKTVHEAGISSKTECDAIWSKLKPCLLKSINQNIELLYWETKLLEQVVTYVKVFVPEIDVAECKNVNKAFIDKVDNIIHTKLSMSITPVTSLQKQNVNQGR